MSFQPQRFFSLSSSTSTSAHPGETIATSGLLSTSVQQAPAAPSFTPISHQRTNLDLLVRAASGKNYNHSMNHNDNNGINNNNMSAPATDNNNSPVVTSQESNNNQNTQQNNLQQVFLQTMAAQAAAAAAAQAQQAQGMNANQQQQQYNTNPNLNQQ